MSTWPDHYIRANDASLHYYRTGGDKPPIVLLHGFTDNALCWTRLARVLEAEYDVIMVDARYHGLSEGPATGFSGQLRADDTAAFIQALHLERPFLLGHSMGAATAALVAAQHPDLIRAILLEDPAWLAHTSPERQANQVREVSDHPWYPWVAAARAQTREERIKAAQSQNPAWVEEELIPWADAIAQFNLVAFKYNTPPSSWREMLPHISCPILLITADPGKGAIVTPEVAQEATRLWKDGQVIHIEGAGHSIHRDQFAPYCAAVTAFLRDH